MLTFFLLLHVLVCIALMVSILLQSSKGGGLAGTFGGSGAGGAVFGGRGMGTFLSKVTTICGIIFFLSSIGHSLYSKGHYQTQAKSLIQQDAENRVTTPATGLPGIPAQDQQTQQAQDASKTNQGEQQKKDDSKPAEQQKK